MMRRALKILPLSIIIGFSFLIYSCEYAAEKVLDCALLDECPKPTVSPQETIEKYYQLINFREYPEAWTMLSPRFQRLVSKDDYSDYVEWWDSVELVELGSVTVISESDDVAVVNAELTYLMKTGRESKDPKGKFMLVPGSNGKWLIDNKR